MSTRPILVIGAGGQLGAELCRQLGERGVGLTRSQCDLLEPIQVSELFQRWQPSAVINTAAYTAVDRAEQEPALCRAINAEAVARLADLCRDHDCTLCQLSTDYVFGADATRQLPYQETDEPGPLSVYGATKLAGERIAATWQKHLIVRTCGLYGQRTKPTQTNFVDTMLRLANERDRLKIVDDQHCTPSYVPHVAKGILSLIDTRQTGIYHLVNRGATTWYDFAKEIFRLREIQIPVQRISTAEYNAPASRPRYSVLHIGKFESLGLRIPTWQEALAEYLQTD